MKSKILIADDDSDVLEAVVSALEPFEHDIASCGSGEAALELLEASEFDVLVSDHQMPQMTGVELCRQARVVQPNLAVILLTGFGNLEVATEALRAGANDFVTKPVAINVLLAAVERAVRRQVLRRELEQLGDAASTPSSGIVGSSEGMRRVLDIVGRIARSEATVLVRGETGTGKELVARAIHDQSGRRGRFVAVNCSAMAEGILESELFGHMPGAFTDARSERTGLFVSADGGTLFLDEIGDMGLAMQSKLLRALQERTVRPLGGSREVSFDTRIVAATNRDLEAAVAAKQFREDLFYRVNVITIDVPPLWRRMEDVLPLAHHFIAQASKDDGQPAVRLSRAVAERLMAYEWPGNVRELENAMERAVAVARFDELIVDDLPPRLRGAVEADPVDLGPDGELTSMEVVEERYIQKVLDAVQGNKAAAARVLGFDRRTLYRKLQQPGPGSGRSPSNPQAAE